VQFDNLLLEQTQDLISEDGHFMLDQCREIRNNFSSAHPTMGRLDEDEFLSFLNRCAKCALANERNPRHVQFGDHQPEALDLHLEHQ
jgi:hypothetical protein